MWRKLEWFLNLLVALTTPLNSERISNRLLSAASSCAQRAWAAEKRYNLGRRILRSKLQDRNKQRS